MDKTTLLDNIVDYLYKQWSTTKQKTPGGGRISSVLQEKTVTLCINEYMKTIKEWSLIEPDSTKRPWYDIAFQKRDEKIFVNIKITSGGTDNVSSTNGLLWTFSNLKEKEFTSSSSTKAKLSIINSLSKLETNKDYYFIVLFKSSSKPFWTSLRRLSYVKPNASNLPFQTRWEENRKHLNHSYLESLEFLFSIYKKSLKLREKTSTDLINAINNKIN